MKIALNWQVSSFFGWGIYCLNLALEFAKDPSIEASAQIGKLDDIAVDMLRRRALLPFVKRSMRPRDADAEVIDALCVSGDDLHGGSGARVGAIFFETPLSPGIVAQLAKYDTIIAGSTWNADILKGHGLDNVVTIFQGVDRSLFHPAPKRGLYPDKFLIFSGGKAEPRKGQDLVVKAFRIFAEKHRDAMLVTAWHSPWPHLANGMDLDLSRFADRVIDVGQVPNGQMAPVYRECDVALFPNRAEGGTNLVAMECIACGAPTIVSGCTGHDDLLGLPGVLALSDWQSAPHLWSEWGECSVDEIVEALEVSYRNRPRADEWLNSPEPLNSTLFQWSDAASQLADIVKAHQPKERAYG